MKQSTTSLYWLLLSGVLLFCTACTPRLGNNTTNYYEEFPVDRYGNTAFINGAYCGLKNSAGTIIVPANKYIYIRLLDLDNSCAPHVLYKAETPTADGLLDGNGNVVLPSVYESILGCTEGLIIVRTSNTAKLINVKGEEIIPAKYEWLSFTKDSLIQTGNDKKKGLINLKNEVLIPVQYDLITVINKDTIYAYTGPMDSIRSGRPESYEKVAYFSGELTTDLKEEPLETSGVELIVQQMPRFPGCEGISGTDEEKKTMC